MYTATLTQEITAKSGKRLEKEYEWRFRVPIDNYPPKVTKVYPANDSKNVKADATVSAEFSEELQPDTVNKDTFFIKDGHNKIKG